MEPQSQETQTLTDSLSRNLTALEFRGLLLRSPEQGMGHQESTLPVSQAT